MGRANVAQVAGGQELLLTAADVCARCQEHAFGRTRDKNNGSLSDQYSSPRNTILGLACGCCMTGAPA